MLIFMQVALNIFLPRLAQSYACGIIGLINKFKTLNEVIKMVQSSCFCYIMCRINEHIWKLWFH